MTTWEMAVHLAVAGDVFGGVLFCAVLFPQEMSWMRSGTELSQFLRIFPTYSFILEELYRPWKQTGSYKSCHPLSKLWKEKHGDNHTHTC